MFNKTKAPIKKTETLVTPPASPVSHPVSQAPQPPINESPASFAKKPTSTNSQGSRGFSSVGTGLIVEGNVFGTSDLVIDGNVRGDVKVGHLTIGESGSIEGKVEAESIQVRGRVVGSISGKNVHLLSTAYVEGDITHDSISIEVGAFFQGRCLQTKRTENVLETSAPGSAFTPFDPQKTQTSETANETAVPSKSNPYDLSSLADLR